MQATRIVAIRHGETAWNVDTRIQGQLDIPLNAKGEWQAAQLAKALAAQDPLHAVYTSDLKRAHQTATAVAVQQGLEAISHPGLRERGSQQVVPMRLHRRIDRIHARVGDGHGAAARQRNSRRWPRG